MHGIWLFFSRLVFKFRELLGLVLVFDSVARVDREFILPSLLGGKGSYSQVSSVWRTFLIQLMLC